MGSFDITVMLLLLPNNCSLLSLVRSLLNRIVITNALKGIRKLLQLTPTARAMCFVYTSACLWKSYSIPGYFCVAKFLRILLIREIKFCESITMPHLLYCTCGSFAKIFFRENFPVYGNYM